VVTGGRVLVVDDDPTVSDVVARYLRAAGFGVDVVADGAVALEMALARPPDLLVLDLMLPGLDGLEVFRRLRDQVPVPVVMLTARGDETDRVVGLELGADDYVTKPFSPRELVLRVQSVLRRAATPLPPAPDEVLEDGDLRVEVAAHQVTLAGSPLGLTAREYDLLAHLMRHPRRAFTREELLREVWGWEYADHSTVTVHVRRLREKVEVDARVPRRVVTVFGVGYRYEPGGHP
jgi:DNA-binding response OmpR family regulator